MGRPQTEEEKQMPCEVCGRIGNVFFNKKTGMRLCNTHRSQVQRKGCLHRTQKDRNEIVIYKDYAEVVLYNKECQEIARAIIDIEELELIAPYKWSYHSSGYTTARIKNKRMFMHRLIMGDPLGRNIDHINHNPLDNRKQNLRVCTQHENNMNRLAVNPNLVSGVYWKEQQKVWQVQIGFNYQTICLGAFDNLRDAIQEKIKNEYQYYGFSPSLEQLEGFCDKLREMWRTDNPN